MNFEAVMPISAWWAVTITIAFLAAIIQVRTNDYNEVKFRIAHWARIQVGLWVALYLCVVLITGALR